MDVLVWRLAAADHHGVPYRDNRRTVVIGVTADLGEDQRIWFQAHWPDHGIPPTDPVVAEVRTGPRAQERARTATARHESKGWVLVDGPRVVDGGQPELTEADVLAGWPLRAWATGIAEQFRHRDL